MNKQWLKKDEIGFINLSNYITSNKISFIDFKSKVNNLGRTKFYHLFYFAGRYTFVQANGYTGPSITVGVIADKIIFIDIKYNQNDTKIINNLSKKNKKIRELLNNIWVLKKGKTVKIKVV